MAQQPSSSPSPTAPSSSSSSSSLSPDTFIVVNNRNKRSKPASEQQTLSADDAFDLDEIQRALDENANMFSAATTRLIFRLDSTHYNSVVAACTKINDFLASSHQQVNFIPCLLNKYTPNKIAIDFDDTLMFVHFTTALHEIAKTNPSIAALVSTISIQINPSTDIIAYCTNGFNLQHASVDIQHATGIIAQSITIESHKNNVAVIHLASFEEQQKILSTSNIRHNNNKIITLHPKYKDHAIIMSLKHTGNITENYVRKITDAARLPTPLTVNIARTADDNHRYRGFTTLVFRASDAERAITFATGKLSGNIHSSGNPIAFWRIGQSPHAKKQV